MLQYNLGMSQWLSQTDFIRNLSKELLLPRQEHYTEDSFILRMQEHPQLHLRHFKAANPYQQKLYLVVVDSREKKSEVCLLYMHGLGSNILEGSLLIDFLPAQLALCCFDFSGSGKSQGSCSTYGNKEYQDIGSIIKCLRKEGYSKFILWGRSMGAFASLAHTSTQPSPDFLLQILDSPFANFQSVCQQRARHHFHFPELLVSYGVNLMKTNMAEHPFNPFQLNLLDRAGNCRVPTVFVYNEHDQVIPSDNIEELVRLVAGSCNYERIMIEDTHNSNRSAATLQKIMEKVRKAMQSEKIPCKELGKQRRAINVYSSYLKKYGSNKHLPPFVELETTAPTRRKAALFCSLSKTVVESPRKKPFRGV